MARVSIIIPSRNEQFLPQTVADLFAKAAGPIEIIVVLDGYWPEPSLPNYDNLVIIHRGQARGMRPAINAAAAIAKGDYLMKSDAHCMFGEGFDEILKADCHDDWIVIPRRKRLDAENWCEQDVGKIPVDYEFISPSQDRGIKGQIWTQRAIDRKDILIDENLSFQGSCWFATRKHWDWLGGMNPKGYGQFVREAQELGLKTWLGGGKVMVNKKTFYCHLHKGRRFGRGYFLDKSEVDAGNKYCDDFWMNNRWKERKHNIEWLIDRFWPVPTWDQEWMDKARREGRNV